MKRWSKLQKELYKIIDGGIDFQLHCCAYRMKSQRGAASVPRYWITLDGEIIFDYPKQYENRDGYPYVNGASDISGIIREYIDTPVNEIFDRAPDGDFGELTEILKAADRRIGRRRLEELLIKTDSAAAKKVIAARKKCTEDAENSF